MWPLSERRGDKRHGEPESIPTLQSYPKNMLLRHGRPPASRISLRTEAETGSANDIARPKSIAWRGDLGLAIGPHVGANVTPKCRLFAWRHPSIPLHFA